MTASSRADRFHTKDEEGWSASVIRRDVKKARYDLNGPDDRVREDSLFGTKADYPRADHCNK